MTPLWLLLVLAAVSVRAFFLVIATLSRGGMGSGDVKLAAMVGTFLDLAPDRRWHYGLRSWRGGGGGLPLIRGRGSARARNSFPSLYVTGAV
ncbi:MAG: hypothetical protein AUH31_04075 [Armatimonadetes bacterium 13_1_40CM_64_14]|nr:MAG: hypothetical protein AUH31_04075 [Armatimonadetes bacterium 13_1_40CM_64_14]